MPTFGDTTSAIANFSNVIDIINSTAMALESTFAVVGNLVTRHTIRPGLDRVRIPVQNATFAAQSHTDGDEITNVQQFGITTTDLTTSILEITYRLSRLALRQPAIDLAAMAGEEQAMAAAERLEADLLAAMTGGNTQNLAASGAAATMGHIATTRRLLRNITRANGGPPRTPVYAAINAFQEEDILNDLGAVAANVSSGSTNTVNRARSGAIEQLLSLSPTLEDAFFGNLLRIPFFVSNYVGSVVVGSVTTPAHGVAFAKGAIHLGVAEEWEVEPFRTLEWPGISVRAMTDYGTLLGPAPFDRQIVRFDTAIT